MLRILGGGKIGCMVLRSAMRISEFRNITVSVYHPRIGSEWEGLTPTTSDIACKNSQADDVVCLAVKPPQVYGLLEEIRDLIHPEATIISTIAKCKYSELKKEFPTQKIFRVMPTILNDQSLGRVICYSQSNSHYDRSNLTNISSYSDDTVLKRLFPEEILRWVDAERHLEQSTILNGCLPGLIAGLAEEYLSFAESIEFPKSLANDLLASNIAGTGSLLRSKSPSDIVKMVATRGGITETGLEQMKKAGVQGGIRFGLHAMYDKLMN